MYEQENMSEKAIYICIGKPHIPQILYMFYTDIYA